MAQPDAGPYASPLLRGLFGVFQTGAAVGAQTTEIWQDLRQTAGEIQFRTQGVAQPYDPAAVQEAGRAVLSAQGIDAAAVSIFRGLAGQWLQSADRAQRLDPTAQITSREVFTPPWAVTDNPDVPDRYRIRSQWQFEASDGELIPHWQTDEVDGPLTSTGDLTGALVPPVQTYPPNASLADAPPATLTGFEIEQV